MKFYIKHIAKGLLCGMRPNFMGIFMHMNQSPSLIFELDDNGNPTNNDPIQFYSEEHAQELLDKFSGDNIDIDELKIIDEKEAHMTKDDIEKRDRNKYYILKVLDQARKEKKIIPENLFNKFQAFVKAHPEIGKFIPPSMFGGSDSTMVGFAIGYLLAQGEVNPKEVVDQLFKDMNLKIKGDNNV